MFGLAVVFIFDQSRPTELLEKPKPGQDKIYVDAHDALAALVVLGVLAIVLVALASLRIARRSVAPLGEALRMQRSFVADASHELRTPLTVLNSRLQVLSRRLERGEPYEDVLEAAKTDTDGMIEMVTDLLLVAEASASTGRSAVDGSDVRAGVRGAAESLQPLADERQIRLVVDVQGEARLTIGEVGFRRCLVVLLDNAVAHSPAGASVAVQARLDRGKAVIRVIDRGGGIVGIDPATVFDRFAHAQPTAGRTERRSFGVGLALARDLAVQQGGRVLVEQTGPEGTTMRLELPLARG